MLLSENDLNKYLGWIKEGKSFSEIREDLQRQAYSPEQIKGIISEIDEAALQRASQTETGVQRFNLRAMGWVALGTGTALYLWFYFLNEQYLQFSQIKSLVTILVSGGAAMIFVDFRLKRKKINIQRPGKRRFRVNR